MIKDIGLKLSGESNIDKDYSLDIKLSLFNKQRTLNLEISYDN
jgi:hypothetical protein